MNTGSDCQTDQVLVTVDNLYFDFLAILLVEAFHSRFEAFKAVEIKPGVIE
jgi:hypothetical protein